MTPEELEARRKVVRKIIRATEANGNYRMSEERLIETAEIDERRFSRFETPSLPAILKLGQHHGANTVNEFIAIWDMKTDEEYRNAEIEERRRRMEAEKQECSGAGSEKARVAALWGMA